MNFHVPTMAELSAQGIKPDVLFWIGCAGSFDERARRVTKAMAKILHKAGVSFAVLGAEEGCTGDPAKRAGNEFLFQMQALTNIETLNNYGIPTTALGRGATEGRGGNVQGQAHHLSRPLLLRTR